MRLLNQQQIAFVHHYLNNKNNASQAYRDAGYKCGTPKSTWAAASRLLGKVNVQQYIATWRAEIAKQTLIDGERVVTELVAVGCSDITDIVSFKDNEVIYKDSKELPKSVTAAIALIERNETRRTDKEGNETVNTTMKLKMHPKTSSLKMLGDYAGLGDEIAIARRIFRKYGWNVFFDDHQVLQVEKIDVDPNT